MARSEVPGRVPPANRLLAALSPPELDRLQPHLEPVALGVRDVLYEPDGPISHVWFPTSGMASLLTPPDGGRGTGIEVGVVGREGMVGLPVFLGTETALYRALTQVPGAALRLDAVVFREATGASVPAARLLHRFAQVLFNQVAWSAACGRSHSIEQRCARWLLMTHDRVEGDSYPITQEFLCQMLGVRRATVSEVASSLQQAGFIRYSRGKMTIVNRKGLEGAACECYSVIRREYEISQAESKPTA